MARAAQDVYGALVSSCVLPALRGALSNEWRVRQSDEAIEALTWEADAEPNRVASEGVADRWRRCAIR